VKTVDTEHITATEFREWLAAAKPGEVLVYATGALGTDTDAGFIAKDQGAPEAHALAGAAYTAWKDGDAHLVQRRVGTMPADGKHGRFQYIAVKRVQKGETTCLRNMTRRAKQSSSVCAGNSSKT
jgi:hypothetical protein